MKKLFSIVGITALLLLAFSLSAFSQAKSETWKGWISDDHCQAKGMKADHKACALKCVKGGAKYVFVNSETKDVVPIHNQDAVKESDLGQEVNVTGSLTEDKSIHVDSIAPAGGA